MTSHNRADILRRASRHLLDASGAGCRCLSLGDTISLAGSLGLSRREVEIAALEAEIIPDRYRKNMGILGPGGQLRLLRSHVGVAGAGGLGGFVIELLARCGVGALTIIDSDSFEATNLNRQLYSLEESLSLDKAVAAARRVGEINGAVERKVRRCRGDSGNWSRLLQGCHLAMDCLDNVQSRFSLEEACQDLEIPLVHGAIAGFMGQVAVIRPGAPLFSAIYGERGRQKSGGAESYLGNPAFTPAAVAALQVSEAVKLLAGLGSSLEKTLLLMDLFSGETTRIELRDK